MLREQFRVKWQFKDICVLEMNILLGNKETRHDFHSLQMASMWPRTRRVWHRLEPICRWTFTEKWPFFGWSSCDRSFYSIASVVLTARYHSSVIMFEPGWQDLHRRAHQYEGRYSVGCKLTFSSACQTCQALHNVLLQPSARTSKSIHTCIRIYHVQYLVYTHQKYTD